MATHEFEPTVFHVSLGSHEPALHVASGDTVRTWCVDAGGYDRHGEQITEGGNPQTGPFYVEGAALDDTFAVRFERIEPNRDRGRSARVVAANVVDPWCVPELPRREGVDWWMVDLERRTARLETPPAGLESLGELSIEPMLGCFGVAPPRGQAISCATSGQYGGNMDYRGFTQGVTVYFPVFVPGALLHVGDGHAIQGDGEIVGTGIEISFDVEFTVDLRKGEPIGWPRGENVEYIFTAGNARPLDQALQHATTEMMLWLERDWKLDVVAASTLLGQCVEYDVGNVFDPAYTMICKMPKRILRQLTAAS